MYGQFQNLAASAAKWIFIGFMVVICMALFLGADLKDSKWLNPEIAAAEANQLNIDAQHQSEMYKLEQQLSSAKTEAEIREIQRQQNLLDAQSQRDMQELLQGLENRQIAFKTLMAVITLLAGAFAIMLCIVSTLWAGSRVLVYVRSAQPKEKVMARSIPPVAKRIPNVARREPYDSLDRNQIRYNQRINERLQELVNERKEQDDAELLAARMRAVTDPAKMSSREYRKRPQAY